MTIINDIQLWDRFRAGDRSAFHTIYLSEVKYLFNYGRKVFQDDIRTEDSIHDLFVELWERRDSIGTTDNIRKYLAVSMRRKMIANLKIEKKTSADLENENVSFDSELSIEQILIKQELSSEQSSKLKTAYQNLSHRQREILHMRYYQDIPYEQIAEIVGIKYQSLRNVVSNAIKGLRLALTSLVLLIIFTGCTDDDETVGIDQSVQPYIERFEAEAARRNINANIETSGIGAQVATIDGDAVGQCVLSESRGAFLRLDDAYWSRASDLQKEFLVFHKLGHCFLGRGHLDEEDERGSCISIMMSGVGSCRTNHNTNTREQYIDELFSN